VELEDTLTGVRVPDLSIHLRMAILTTFLVRNRAFRNALPF